MIVTTGKIWLRMSLGIAPILARRGSTVDVLVTPYDDSPGDTMIDDYYRLRALRRILPGRPSLRLWFSNELPARPLAPDVRAIVEDVSLLDTQLFLKRESAPDVESNPEHRAIYELRLARNRHLAETLDPMLEAHSYDTLLVPDGARGELAVAFRLAELRGVKRVAFQYAELRDRIVVTADATYAEMPVDGYWEADEPHVLTPSRRARVARFIAERETDNWTSLMQTVQVASTTPGAVARSHLGLRADAPVALLCPNLTWEAFYLSGFGNRGSVPFPMMVDWALHTIGFFGDHPEWELVVRTHPWERHLEEHQRIGPIIEAQYPELPKNVHIVGPSDPISTYSLINATSLGLTYLSTVGLEMAVRGLPVVTAGSPHYARRGFTIDPPDRDAFERTLDGILARPDEHRLSEHQTELAWCYLDVALLTLPQPFPWVGEHFDADYERWPIGRCIDAGDRDFGTTFDLLRGIGWSERGVPLTWRPSEA